MMGRKESVCAQIAVTKITGFSGWQSEPPAARLYAVEPVGVATQIPSAWTLVKCSSSPKSSRVDIAASEISVRSLRVYGDGSLRRTRARTSIDYDIVQDGVRSVRRVCSVVLGLLAHKLLDQIAALHVILLTLPSPHDCAFEP